MKNKSKVDEQLFIDSLLTYKAKNMHHSHIEKTFRMAWRLIKKYRELNVDTCAELAKKQEAERNIYGVFYSEALDEIAIVTDTGTQVSNSIVFLYLTLLSKPKDWVRIGDF